MRCKQAERMLMEFGEPISAELAGHLSLCPRCSSFRDDLERIRDGLHAIPHPAPSEELLGATRTRCLGALASGPESHPRPARIPARIPVPSTIWAALGILILLTGVIMIPGLKELFNRTQSLLSTTALAILLQNAATLFLAPILLRACRNRRIPLNGRPLNGSTS